MKLSGLSPLTKLVKAVIYLAFGIAIIALIYSVGSFIYTMVHAEDLSKVTMTNTYELPAVAEELDAREWETENGAVRFRLHKLYGELSYLNMPRVLVVAAFFRVIVLWALFLVGVVQMANIFEDVGEGKPFVRENARRLRIVGYAMAGGAIFKLIVQNGTFLLFEDAIEIAGARIAWYWLLRETFDLGLLFGGLVVLVISEVFRLGNKLQEEQELTV